MLVALERLGIVRVYRGGEERLERQAGILLAMINVSGRAIIARMIRPGVQYLRARPHFGHAAAFDETGVLQSGHVISAILAPLVRGK